MEIRRAGFDDTTLFSKEKLAHGACCFYTEDRECKYFFEIDGQEAIVHADGQEYTDQAIDEFLFYSNFICCVKSPNGQVLREKDKIKLDQIAIASIQPSQFYINERKLAYCKRWIKSQSDIKIPITVMNGKVVLLDGHTRLRAALDLGYEMIYAYPDDCGEYITYFVDEAIRRNILGIMDMKILDDDEYKIKWHKFCDDFFGRI